MNIPVDLTENTPILKKLAEDVNTEKDKTQKKLAEDVNTEKDKTKKKLAKELEDLEDSKWTDAPSGFYWNA